MAKVNRRMTRRRPARVSERLSAINGSIITLAEQQAELVEYVRQLEGGYRDAAVAELGRLVDWMNAHHPRLMADRRDGETAVDLAIRVMGGAA